MFFSTTRLMVHGPIRRCGRCDKGYYRRTGACYPCGDSSLVWFLSRAVPPVAVFGGTAFLFWGGTLPFVQVIWRGSERGKIAIALITQRIASSVGAAAPLAYCCSPRRTTQSLHWAPHDSLLILCSISQLANAGGNSTLRHGKSALSAEVRWSTPWKILSDSFINSLRCSCRLWACWATSASHIRTPCNTS